MSDQTDKLSIMFNELGVDDSEQQVYLYVNKNGSSTALTISKDCHMGRTKVYRILDKLIEKQLVVQNLGTRGLYFETTGSKQLSFLLSQKRAELFELEHMLPEVVEFLSNERDEGEIVKSQTVRYYRGIKGLEQVTWNSLKAQKFIYIFEISDSMSAFLDNKFSEQVREELVSRRIHVKQITNLKHIKSYTSVSELVKSYWDVKYIDPKLLTIKFETLIYNNTVAMYSFEGKEPFCIEITDSRLAKMQKQLFSFVWKSAQEMQKIGDKGEAKGGT